MKGPRTAILCAILSWMFASATHAADTGKPLTFAAVPFYTPERMWQLYSPFVAYLGSHTGASWELKLYSDHEELIGGVCSGEVSLALLGPVPLGRANAACGAEPLLVAVARDGRPVYRAMFLTGDPAVASLEDLRGRKVGFFRGSTAAHVVPLRMLRDAGLAPGAFEEVFFESQDRLIAALLERKVSGAGVKESLYRRFEREPVRLLQTSAELPNFALVALPTLPQAVRERVAAALLPLRPRERAADAAVMEAWDDEVAGGFVTPSPEFLPGVRRLRDQYEAAMHESR